MRAISIVFILATSARAQYTATSAVAPSSPVEYVVNPRNSNTDYAHGYSSGYGPQKLGTQLGTAQAKKKEADAVPAPNKMGFYPQQKTDLKKFIPTLPPSKIPHNKLIEHPDGFTLRDWIIAAQGPLGEGDDALPGCLNIASQPLMNTQFAQLGALDALHDSGLLENVTGYSGVSSGAFVMALAASKNFRQRSRMFRDIWPGWTNIIPDGGEKMADPLLSRHYHDRILERVLPKSFEELRVPLAVTAVAYDDEQAAAMVDERRSQPMVISDGALRKAVIVSSSAMVGAGCPRCLSGFQAKEFRGHWPVADGFLKDEYGTLGLAALDPCENLLHFQPQNFAQQLSPTKNSDLDTQPLNVVSLGLDVPSSAIMSMMWDSLLKPLNSLRAATFQGRMQLGKVANQDEIWEKLQYESAYDHMIEALDQPMKQHEKPMDDEEHYFVDLDMRKHWDKIRGWGERRWDQKFDFQHADYWMKTAGRRNRMVQERNALMKNNSLSFRECGNGMGAPLCNSFGEVVPPWKWQKGLPKMKINDGGGFIGKNPMVGGIEFPTFHHGNHLG